MDPDMQNDVLIKLSDADLTLSDPNQDIRGRNVIDQHGEEIGQVSGLFIDKTQKKVRLLQVAAGGFLGLGEPHFLIPVEAVSSVTQDEVRISHTREHVANSPAYDPNLTAQVPTLAFWEPYYGYYGSSHIGAAGDWVTRCYGSRYIAQDRWRSRLVEIDELWSCDKLADVYITPQSAPPSRRGHHAC